MKISEQAREIVTRWAPRRDRPLKIDLTATDHPNSEELRRFCHWLAGQCDRVQVSEANAGGDALPALSIRQGAITYRAVPAGTELEPFLEALAEEIQAPPGLRPAALQLHVAAACPHCPAAVRSLLPLVAAGGPLSLEVIDSEALADVATAANVKSVPTLILDGAFRFTGALPIEDIEALLTAGNPTTMDAGLLERLLEQGNAPALADQMVSSGTAAPALGRLLAAEALSVRIGAMMVVEDLLERAPLLVEQLVPGLVSQMADAPDPARGDILYIIGEAGPASLMPRIHAILETDLHPEVAEAAREALARLAKRHQ